MTERLPVEDMGLHAQSWNLTGASISGGQSVSGQSQSVRSDGGGLWRLRAGFKLRTPADMKKWRAFGARLDGGATSIVVPRIEAGLKVQLEGTETVESATHSDGSTLSDGSEYDVIPEVSASPGASAALRATQMQLAFTSAVVLEGGECFTIEHATQGDRLYTIHSVVAQANNTYTVKIRPPLREAITTSTVLDFDDPRCLMRLADPDSWEAEARGLRFADPSAVFIEHIDPQAAA